VGAVRRVLVLNFGSSTLKWALLDALDESTVSEGCERLRGAGDEPIGVVLGRVASFDAVGHRIVHGGRLFRETVVVDPRVREGLESLVELDPIHMRHALAAVDAVGARFPVMPQFAVFDTAFHATMPEAAAGYGLPFEWTERWGLQRFGFHGLSVAHATRRAREMTGRTPPRLVVCHLGSGCSVTAVKEARSVDTTMGFTPLEGLMMETRSGSVDPGLLLHLQLRRGMGATELRETLTEKSGLLGVSGVSGDLREVLAAADAGSRRAALAYERFTLSAKRAIGSMMAVLGGLDALVFTGGIGENSPRVRHDLTSSLIFAGAHLDEVANQSATTDVDVARRDSAARILLVRAREDLVILREVLRHRAGGA
jgi:acetate kinase